MESVFLLIPLAIALVVLIIWAVVWAIQSGQFDDLEGPAHSILMDEDEPMAPSPLNEKKKRENGQ